MMKRIALFGATGGTGKEVLKLALNKGFKVQALVREPDKLTINDQNLTIIPGDILNEKVVQKTVAGTDIVVSVFGHVKGSPEWLQTNGTKNILKAMEHVGIKHILSLSGGGTPFPEKDEPKFIDKMIRGIMKIVVPKILNDAIRHTEVLRNSNMAWTVVRAPRLTNQPAKGNYKVTWVGVNAGTSLTRSDLAHYIMHWVENPEYLGEMPFVTN